MSPRRGIGTGAALLLVAVLAGLLAILGSVLGNPELFDAYAFRILMVMGINVTLAVSLNLVNGLAGQFSIGHAGFMSVGAYTSAALTYYVMRQAQGGAADIAWMVAALAVGGLAGAIAGLVVGLPSLRLRGDYLAIVTLGFGEIIRILILNIDAVGGPRGLSGIPRLTSFFWVWAVALGTVALSRNLATSTHGRALMAIREDELAAECLGVNTVRYKVAAFVLSSALAGVAGALYAHYDAYLNPASFSFLRSFEIIIMVILGGMGSTSGAVVGAVIITLLPELLRSAAQERMVVYAVLLILLMLLRPQGLMGSREVTLRGLRALWPRRKGVAR
jgi:branched-chain amino acid transport system permease protein